MWVVVLGACAAAGAYVAANTDPFPPGVEDPGARGNSGPDTTEAPAGQARRWRVVIRSTSTHAFRVGGACRTTWRAGFRAKEDPSGALEGAGVAELVDGPVCDFPVAQVQAESADLRAAGSIADGVLAFELRAGETTPAGAADAGGFLEMVGEASFEVAHGDRARVVLKASDGRGGTFRTVTTAAVRCARGCEG